MYATIELLGLTDALTKQADASDVYLNNPTQYRDRFKDKLLGVILGGTGGAGIGTVAGGLIAHQLDASAKNQALSALIGAALGGGLGAWGGSAAADHMNSYASKLAVEAELEREQLRQQLRGESEEEES